MGIGVCLLRRLGVRVWLGLGRLVGVGVRLGVREGVLEL